MNTKNLKFADSFALLVILISLLAPFLPRQIKVNINILIILINCYIIAYLAYNISFMDTKKVGLFALPMFTYLLFLLVYLKGFDIELNKYLLNDISYLLINFFDIIFVVFTFFIVELILSRIFGTMITNIIAIISLLIYLVIHNTSLIPFGFPYKDLFIYFTFYVIASRISPANSINKALYPLAFLLLAGEIYLSYRINFYPGIYFSIFIITYLTLKADKNPERITFTKYLSLSYLYPYKVIYILIENTINSKPLITTIMAILTIYLLSQLFYKLRFKVIDYLYIGIH